MSLAGRLIAALHASPKSLDEFYKLGLKAEYFKGEEEQAMFDMVMTHVTKHGVLPAKETIEAAISTIIPVEAPEPPSFYRDQMRDRYVHQAVKQAALDAIELDNQQKPHEAYALLKTRLLAIHLNEAGSNIVNYATDATAMLKAELGKEVNTGLQFGWNTLDNMSGGLQGGDVLTFVGRPAAGKTYLMLKGAMHAWKVQKKVPLLISMEMKPLALVQRMAAMDAKIGVTGIKKKEYHGTGKLQNKLWTTLDGNKDLPPFRIVDGALAASMDDIVMYAQQFKPDAVYIDGAYLIRPKSRFGSHWEKQNETLGRVKGDLAERLNLPVCISFQLNRGATKLKKGEDPGLENIAYSDAVGQLSSIVLGLMDDDPAVSKNVEYLYKRRVTIMKGRNGENGDFHINWIFDKYPFMDFDEWKEPEVSKLQY